MSLAKGVALITGSAQGIGRSIALRLAKDGFNIALNDVSSKWTQLDAVASDIEKIGRRTHLVPADVSIDGEVKQMVRNTVESLGGLDVMVANAGVAVLKEMQHSELDDWERVMAVNARGVFLCYKYAAEQMIAQARGGRIIGASSAAGKSGVPLASVYSASKFAVRGLTQTAALELGRHRITVNSYAPGRIDTPMLRNSQGQFESADKDLVEWTTNYFDGKPIKYDGQLENIASIVSYLASTDAHFITGQCISVDGGLTMS